MRNRLSSAAGRMRPLSTMAFVSLSVPSRLKTGPCSDEGGEGSAIAGSTGVGWSSLACFGTAAGAGSSPCSAWTGGAGAGVGKGFLSCGCATGRTGSGGCPAWLACAPFCSTIKSSTVPCSGEALGGGTRCGSTRTRSAAPWASKDRSAAVQKNLDRFDAGGLWRAWMDVES